jgi:hypothetical protein
MMGAIEDFLQALLACLQFVAGVLIAFIVVSWAATGISPIEVFLK